MIIKVTHSFAGHRYGWTETHWREESSSNLDDVYANTELPFAQARAAMLAAGYTLATVRIQIVRSNEGVTIRRRGRLFEPNLPGNSTWAPAPPKEAVLMQWNSAALDYRRLTYVAGNPSNLNELGNTVVLWPPWLSAFNLWRGLAVTSNYGWLHQAIAAETSITNYVSDESTGEVIMTLADSDTIFGLGTSLGRTQVVDVQFGGSERHPLDGRQVVVKTTQPVPPATTGDCGLKRRIVPRPFDLPGTMRRYSLALVGVGLAGGETGSVHPQRMVTRKKGRVPYASRGRSYPTTRF